MRKLWEDHVTWTRMVIVSVAHDLPDLDVAVARLLRNQADIGDAIRPFYGDDAADALTALLEEHIATAADVLAAAKAGDQAALQDALDRWYDNARRIGRFLHRANPEAWPREEMVSMMTEHLDLTLAEATARLSSDYAADVAAYDRVHRQALRMADMLSDGIVAAFPDRFSA